MTGSDSPDGSVMEQLAWAREPAPATWEPSDAEAPAVFPKRSTNGASRREPTRPTLVPARVRAAQRAMMAGSPSLRSDHRARSPESAWPTFAGETPRSERGSAPRTSPESVTSIISSRSKASRSFGTSAASARRRSSSSPRSIATIARSTSSPDWQAPETSFRSASACRATSLDTRAQAARTSWSKRSVSSRRRSSRSAKPSPDVESAARKPNAMTRRGASLMALLVRGRRFPGRSRRSGTRPA